MKPKEDIWRARVERLIASGQSAREFAEIEGVNPKSLSGYKSHFARQARERTPQLVKVRVTSQATEPSTALEIVLANGVVLRVAEDVEEALLRKVARALGESR